MPRKRKAIVSLILCLLALAAGGGVFALLAGLEQPPEAGESAEKVYQVEVFDAQSTSLQEILSGFGTVRANREVVVSAQVAGEVLAVHPRLKIGSEISAPEIVVGQTGASERHTGDLLAEVDPKSYQERVIQAEQRLAEDDAELERLSQEEQNNARMLAKVSKDYETFDAEYERIKNLRERNTVTQSQLARALLEFTRYEEALIQQQNEKELFPLRRAQIEQRRKLHQSELQAALLEHERTKIRAPFSGRLSEVMVERGQYVREGDAVVRITDVSSVEIPVPLTLRDYAKIEADVKSGRFPPVVLADNETAPGRWFGDVVRVAPEADESTRTINIFVHVDNREQTVPLLPGTFVHARIDGPILNNVLVVPRDAFANGRLFVAKDGRAESREATVRRTLQSLAVIESGVETGDQVVLTNLDVIHDGARVSIQLQRTLSDELENQRTQIARQTLAGGGSDRGESVN